jgi:hypothetical protein
MAVYATPDLAFGSVISGFFYSFWNLFAGFLIPVTVSAEPDSLIIHVAVLHLLSQCLLCMWHGKTGLLQPPTFLCSAGNAQMVVLVLLHRPDLMDALRHHCHPARRSGHGGGV